MADTKTNRSYAWALQSNFQTAKAIAAGALKRLLATDDNLIDYEAKTNTNEDWAHGYNSATDQWIEAHDAKVSHQIPGFAQELGKVFYLNLGDVVVTTPSGATVARKHTFKPTDPMVTRQDPAVTYVERAGAGWHKLMPRAVGDGFTLKGSGIGILTCDFNLLGAGLIVSNPAVTYPPTLNATVANLSGLHKLFNTQVSVTPNDGKGYGSPYSCAYRGFELNFKKTMLSDAGYKPGCGEFFIAGDPTSGLIRSAHEFDKQMLDFTLEVDLAANTPEFDAVTDQRPIAIVIDVIGGIIESSIRHQLTITLNVTRYKSSKPALVDGMWRFQISGTAFYDTTTNNLFKIDLTTNVTSFATAF